MNSNTFKAVTAMLNYCHQLPCSGKSRRLKYNIQKRMEEEEVYDDGDYGGFC